MTKKVELKRKLLIGKREIIITVVAIILATAGIKASDTLFSPKADEAKDSGLCPLGMIFITSDNGGFCIDKYEASVSPDCPYVNPVSKSEARTNLDYPNCEPVTAPNTLPWRYISQDQAALACAKAGKRLPTNKEWLQAALGTPDKNDSWSRDDCQVNKNWDTQPGKSGSGKNCLSFAGVYDMIGNVWEWVDGAVHDGKYDGLELPKSGFIDSLNGASLPGETNQSIPNEYYNEDYLWVKSNGLRGIVRGGYWNNKSDAGQYSVYIVAPPSSTESGIGFRCVK